MNGLLLMAVLCSGAPPTATGNEAMGSPRPLYGTRPAELVAAPLTARWLVEGTIQSRSPKGPPTLMLRGCSVPIELPANLPQAETLELEPEQAVRLVGSLNRDQHGLRFRAESVTPIPDERQRFHEWLELLQSGTSAENFALSDWAASLAYAEQTPFWQARSLQAARQAVERGRELAGNDPAALKRLLEQSDQHLRRVPILNRSEPLRRELEAVSHRELWARMRSQQQTTPMTAEDYRSLSEEIGKRIRLADPSRPALDPPLRGAYWRNPLETFEAADTGTRGRMARYLQVTLLVSAQRLAVDNHADLARHAMECKRRMPDYPEIAQQWYRLWSDEEARRLSGLSEGEVWTLATVVGTELSERKHAANLMRRWLDEQQEELTENAQATPYSARKLFRLGELRLRWFADPSFREWFGSEEPVAISVIERSLAWDPGLTAATRTLERLGQPPANPLEVPNPRGVEELLLERGPPKVKSRVFTQRPAGENTPADPVHVTEIFRYPEPGLATKEDQLILRSVIIGDASAEETANSLPNRAKSPADSHGDNSVEVEE